MRIGRISLHMAYVGKNTERKKETVNETTAAGRNFLKRRKNRQCAKRPK